jgi:hypothetical protein
VSLGIGAIHDAYLVCPGFIIPILQYLVKNIYIFVYPRLPCHVTKFHQYVVLCHNFHFYKNCLLYFCIFQGSDIIQNETCFCKHEVFTRLPSFDFKPNINSSGFSLLYSKGPSFESSHRQAVLSCFYSFPSSFYADSGTGLKMGHILSSSLLTIIIVISYYIMYGVEKVVMLKKSVNVFNLITSDLCGRCVELQGAV